MTERIPVPVRAAVKGATRSWTIWFAIGLAAFGALQLEMDHIQEMVSHETFGWFNIATGIIIAVLRVLTTTSLVERGQQ